MSLYRRSPLRFLAPVALIAFGVALMMVISSYGNGDTNSGPSANEQAKERDLGATTAAAKKAKKKKRSDSLPKNTYSVKTGDNLGSINISTGCERGEPLIIALCPAFVAERLRRVCGA